MISRMGVPSTRSAPRTRSTGPCSAVRSIPASRTADRAMGLGRKGDRVANTPIRRFPPSLGGRTVGDQSSRAARSKTHTSHRWEKSSSPRRAAGSRYGGSKITVASSSSTRPLCRGHARISWQNHCGSGQWLSWKIPAAWDHPRFSCFPSIIQEPHKKGNPKGIKTRTRHLPGVPVACWKKSAGLFNS